METVLLGKLPKTNTTTGKKPHAIPAGPSGPALVGDSLAVETAFLIHTEPDATGFMIYLPQSQG